MKLNGIRKMAKVMGINSSGMHKIELIRTIQRAEHNFDCYGTERVGRCQEMQCLWRSDCLTLSDHSEKGL
jgi:hypothetical protein